MIGAIGYCCHSGLGHLARDFYRHGIVNRMLLVRHPHYPSHPEWYPPEHSYDRSSVGRFLSGLDVLLLFETAVGSTWDVVRQAKARRIKVVMIPMHEWSPYPPPVAPDLYLCPSLLDVDYYRSHPHAFLPIPVEKPWKLRERARTFVHNAGHGQHEYSKGTLSVIAAMEYVRSPVQLIVRGQPSERRIAELFEREKDNPRLQIQAGDLPDEQLWTGDVFLNAEEYNGLSLPLQEAWASGMLVMTTDRFPANTWLPREPLIPVAGYRPYRIATSFERAIIDPRAIAATIDAWYDRDITAYSLAGKDYAEKNSWEVLGPKYASILGALA